VRPYKAAVVGENVKIRIRFCSLRVLEIKDEVPPTRVDLTRVVIGSLSVPLEQPRSPWSKQHQKDGQGMEPYLKHAA
jgi:hypothetical protein